MKLKHPNNSIHTQLIIIMSNSINPNNDFSTLQLPKIISHNPHHDPLLSITQEKQNFNNLTKNNDNIQEHLVLHFDINETILIGDGAGGDTVDESLNKIIAKSAFVQIPTDYTIDQPMKDIVPTHWWDGTPIVQTQSVVTGDASQFHIPPLYTGWEWPKGTCPYYRTSFKYKAKTFTNSNVDGAIYRPLYEYLKQKISNLSTKCQTMSSSSSSSSLPKTHPFYRMLPSFFSTLVQLQKEQKEYTLCLRTMGSDLEDIASALTDFANGKHPLYPNFQEPNLVLSGNQLYKGRWRDVKNDNDAQTNDDSYDSFVFDLFPYKCNKDNDNDNNDNSIDTKIASGDDAVLNIIQSLSACGIQDDYHHWNKHNYAPWAGKPLWINSHHANNQQQKKYHLFFDDNIHNDENDSIVAVREFVGGKWISLSGAQTIQQQGAHLFRVPTVEAILNDDWFHQQISKVEKKKEKHVK